MEVRKHSLLEQAEGYVNALKKSTFLVLRGERFLNTVRRTTRQEERD
jgi:hypothetical protein